MTDGSSVGTFPSVYPSLDEDLITQSTKPMTTPIHTGYSTSEKSTGQTTPLQYQYQPFSLQNQPVPIVAIGNPGAGKSSILNSLAGQTLFESGISLGCGLTNQLEAKEANGREFIDTPGIADDTYQQAAAEALTKVFNQGGRMKILFFVSQEAGRIVSQDATTMKLILESVPEIGQNYGIIVNKVPSDVLSRLSEGETFLKFILSLYSGIGDGFRNKNTLLLPLNNKLNNKNNVVLPPSEIHPDLENFIDTTVPEAHITPGLITQIQLDDFEQLSQQVQELESQLRNQERQKAETEKLVAQFENMEKQIIFEHEEAVKRDEEELKKIKKMVTDKEEEIKNSKQKSENEKRNLEQKTENERRELQQKEQEINDRKNQICEKRIAAHKRKAMKSRRHIDWSLLDLFGTDFGRNSAEMTVNGVGQ